MFTAAVHEIKAAHRVFLPGQRHQRGGSCAWMPRRTRNDDPQLKH